MAAAAAVVREDVPPWAACSVCHMVMHEPRMFQCGHSLCLKCQLRLVASKCPTCQSTSNRVMPNYALKHAIEFTVDKKYREEAARVFEEWQVEDLSKKILRDHDVILSKFDTPEREIERKHDLCTIFRYQYWVDRKKDMQKFSQFCKRYGIVIQKVSYTVSNKGQQVTDASIIAEAAIRLVPGYTTILRKKRDITYYVAYHT